MRLNTVAVVWRTELLNAVRDRRTLLLSGLLPLLLYPLMGVGFVVLSGSFLRDDEKEVSRVVVLGDATRRVTAELERNDRMNLLENAPVDPEAALASRSIDALVVAPSALDDALAGLDGVKVVLRYDPGEFRSILAARRIEDALADWNTRLLTERLARQRLPEGFARPVAVAREGTGSPVKRAMFVVGPLVIFCIIFLSFLGVFYPAVDLTAGDRERSTIETLLTAPVRPAEVVVGKFLAVVALGTGACIVNVTALLATAAVLSSEIPAVREVLPYSLGRAAWAVLFTVPTVAMFGAICMVIGCVARSFKDAQNYAAPLMMLSIVPAYAPMLPGLELTTTAATVPIANLSLLLRELLLRGTLPWAPALICLAASVSWCALALAAAARLYSHEELAFADADAPARSLFRRPPSRRAVFSPAEGLSLTVVAMAFLFYAGLLVVRRFGLVATVPVQLVMGLGIPSFVSWWRRVSVKGGLSVATASWRAIVSGFVTGIGAWGAGSLLYQFVQAPILPVLPEQTEAVRKLLSFEQPGGALYIIGVAALIPGICEELLFRGALLSCLRPFGARTATIVSALAFTLAHFEPARTVPLFALGLAAAWLAWSSRSVVPAIVFHVTNNTIAVLLENVFSTMESLSGWFLLAALAASGLFVLGLWLAAPGPSVSHAPQEPLS